MNCTVETGGRNHCSENQVNEGMELLLKKVYTVSSKNDPETPRVWLQSLVCKRASFEKGQTLYVSIDEHTKEITIQTQPISHYMLQPRPALYQEYRTCFLPLVFVAISCHKSHKSLHI